MAVEINDADWDVLDRITPGGINEDDVAYSINAYRQEGRSDEEIQGIINTRVSEAKNALAKVAKSSEALEAKKARIQRTWDVLDTTVAPTLVGVNAALNTASMGLGDLATAGIDKLAPQLELVNNLQAARKEHPIAELGGNIAGFFFGAPRALAKAGAKSVATIAPQASSFLGKTAVGASKGIAEGMVMQAGMELQRTAEKVAGTQEWESEQDAYNRMAGESKWTIGLGTVFGGSAPAAQKLAGGVKNIISRIQKAINLAGGETVIKNAQAAQQAALRAGGSVEDGMKAFWYSLMKDNPEKNRVIIEDLLRTNPEFAQFMRKQMAGANGVVVDTLSQLTKPQLGEYSNQILKNLYGPEYKNALGATDFDNSIDGLKWLLGTKDAAKANQAIEEALGRAQARFIESPSLQRDVKQTFDNLSGKLKQTSYADYQKALGAVEQNSIRSFEGSAEQMEALQNINNYIQEAANNGTQLTAQQIDNISNNMLRAGSRKHFEKIMLEGPESVMDVNDIKNFFKSVDERAVKAGQAEAFGAFNEGVNTQILDKLDQGLYEAHQALRYEKLITDMHQFGRKFTPNKMEELSAVLNDTTSAEAAAAKLAAFKMGYVSQMTEAAVSGNRKAYSNLAEALLNKRQLGQYFSKEEVKNLVDSIKPHVEAAYNIKQLANAANGFSGEANEIKDLTNLITSGALNARGAFLHNITNTIFNKYGSGTARRFMELAQNPTWANFNRLVRGAKDFTEKQVLSQDVNKALQVTNAVLNAERNATEE